jgi:hypothetical protein
MDRSSSGHGLKSLCRNPARVLIATKPINLSSRAARKVFVRSDPARAQKFGEGSAFAFRQGTASAVPKKTMVQGVLTPEDSGARRASISAIGSSAEALPGLAECHRSAAVLPVQRRLAPLPAEE